MNSAKMCLALCAAALIVSFTGCSWSNPQPADTSEDEVSIRPAVTQADPEKAVDMVYGANPDIIAERLAPGTYRKQFQEITDAVSDYYGAISSPNNGLGDLIILKPEEESRDLVRESLHQYRERRVKEFENYDILDSHEIAKNAQIYDQGEYVILVMFADNDAVMDIIDEYIPL